MSEPQPTFERLARNAVLAAIARLLMIAFATVGPALAGWIVTRILETQDKQSAALTEVAKSVALIQQRIDTVVATDIATINSRIGDHETRLRELERPVPLRARP